MQEHQTPIPFFVRKPACYGPNKVLWRPEKANQAFFFLPFFFFFMATFFLAGAAFADA